MNEGRIDHENKHQMEYARNYVYALNIDDILYLNTSNKKSYNYDTTRNNLKIYFCENNKRILDDIYYGTTYLISHCDVRELNGLFLKDSFNQLSLLHTGKRLIGTVVYSKYSRKLYILEKDKKYIFNPILFSMSNKKKKRELMELDKDSNKLKKFVNFCSLNKEALDRERRQKLSLMKETEGLSLQVKDLDEEVLNLNKIVELKTIEFDEINKSLNELADIYKQSQNKIDEQENIIKKYNEYISLYVEDGECSKQIHITFDIISFDPISKLCEIDEIMEDKIDRWLNESNNTKYISPLTSNHNLIVIGKDSNSFTFIIKTDKDSIRSQKSYEGILNEGDSFVIQYSGNLKDIKGHSVKVAYDRVN